MHAEHGTPPVFAKEKGQAAWDAAREGDLEGIDPDILVRHYGTLKRIKEETHALHP